MSGLERVITDEEHQYAAQLIVIESRRQQIAGLQHELDELSAALNSFERQYRARLGGLHSEIDRLRTEINDYRERINVLRVRAANRDPLPSDPPPIDDDPNGEGPNFDHFSANHRRPVVDHETMEALRRIYRELAKRFHPDLATNLEERERREAIMLRINDAYGQRNLAALEAIAREAEHDDPGFGFRPIVERLAWASLELVRLDGAITQIENQISTLRSSRTYEYWRASEAIDDAIDRLVNEAREKSDKLKERLREYTDTHDKLRARLDARERFRQISARRLHASQ
jgi:chromosome segregation ATPase